MIGQRNILDFAICDVYMYNVIIYKSKQTAD